MRIKIQPLISIQFDSRRARAVALHLLILLRALILSTFVFVVAVADMNVDMRIPGPVKTAARYMYFPVYAVTLAVPSPPGTVCAFQHVRKGLGYAPTCVFSMVDGGEGSADAFGMNKFYYYEADWREHVIYSGLVYLVLLNLFAALLRSGASAMRRARVRSRE